ncbi:MAG: hypothetical protein HOP12_05645 [Candidatus Eisenbacteria bacterium]|uniref:Ppx/GppA phosphatase N-terminal domain-containing protein n=1 Tax=Eiseniibacteriota bacterium TaxID=2212470 RepID=A0A849SWX0_UNCEI|nr:hypothetical protein [Candidatus Eisenbacteria bacterium]
MAEVSGPEEDPSLTAVARAGEACRLGRGLDRTGLIEPEMAGRAADLVAEFLRRARAIGARRVIVGATAALRTASNGPEIAAGIERRCGVSVRVLSGEEEARLVYEAVVTGFGAAAWRSPCVVFDLGGGSTEVVSGLGRTPGRWTSLGFGAVTLTEKFLSGSPPSPDDQARLVAQVEAQIMRDCAYMPTATPILAGVGGTVTVLASLDRGLETYDPALLEGWLIETERLGALIEKVALSSEAERATWSVLGHGRSDIVAAGALVIQCLARRFSSRGLMCSTRGLRYGLARLAVREGQPLPDGGAPGEASG